MPPMAIPFDVSRNNQRLLVPLNSEVYIFDNIHWNSQDPTGSAWYFDLREEDETLIAGGIKLVLGALIGRNSDHAFFDKYKLILVDTSGEERDPGFDDLGSRIQLVILTEGEVQEE